MINSIKEILEAAQRGEPFVMLDDEKRENEGDLIVLAEYISPELINFMLQNCRGFICLAIDQSIADRLGLEMQRRRNISSQDCAFTESIDARHGIQSGTSAQDRAKTINVAIAANSTQDDIKTPGHVSPAIANKEGVLHRAGHTEAAVEIARFCSSTPAAILCEILREDGSMARRNELLAFAQKNAFKISTIPELIKYKLCQ